MAYELREGFGNSFSNSFKEKDTQPDFTGDGMYKGEVVRLVLWEKKTAKGDTFLSWAISPKEEKKEPTDYVATPNNEDIPF